MHKRLPQILFLSASALTVAFAGASKPALAADAAATADVVAFAGLWLSGGRDGPAGQRPDAPPARRAGGELRGPPHGADAAQAPAQIAHIEGLDRADLRTWSLMTPAGRAAFAAMDPADLPVNNCQPAGLPHIAGAPGLQEWSVADGVLAIRHEFSSAVRSIDLSRAAHAEGHSAGGDAIAWMEGDTLVIETAGLTDLPGGLARNAPGSDSRVVTERYALAADGALRGEMTIADPEYLSAPVTMPIGLTPAAPGTALEFFECSIENARRYLD